MARNKKIIKRKKRRKVRLWLILALFLALGIISFFFDKQISLFMQTMHNSSFDSLFEFWRYIIIPSVFTGLIILIMALPFFLKKNKKKWIIKMILAFVFSSAFVFAVKHFFSRYRPYIALNLPKPPIADLGSSFPSSHAAVAFALLPFFEEEYPKLKYLWIVFVLILCFLRVYFPVHYLSDVIIGSVIGYCIGYTIKKIKIKWKK